MIRAKFKCESIQMFFGGETVQLTAVYADSDENKTWSQYTPSGSLVLTITNPKAQGKFMPGRQYYLDIVEA